MRRSSLRLEPLEPRETPATLVNPTTVTYQDTDGDNVTVQFSKPLLDANNVGGVFTFDSAFATTGPQQLRAIDLTVLGQAARGVSITHSAVRSPAGGDGLAAVGHINGALIDLGTVVIDGDLGRIFAGDTDLTTPGLAGLTVQSLGRFALTTGAPDLQSLVSGTVGALRVRGDIVEASFVAVGVDASIGSVAVGGSIFGSLTTTGFLAIQAQGNLGPTVVKGDLVGGSKSPAAIVAGKSLASLTVGGSFLVGGGMSGAAGGVGNVGPVIVRGSVVGGTVSQTGSIISLNGSIASVAIGGSLIGGSDAQSGTVLAPGDIGSVSIGGDMIGGGGVLAGTVLGQRSLGKVKIRGSVVGGTGISSALVGSGGDMGQVEIGGDLRGGSSNSAGSVAAAARIAGVRVGGSLLAGAGASSGGISAGADLGPVSVRGSVIGGSGTDSGQIASDAKLGQVKIGDDLVGGSGLNSGRVRALQTLAGVTIGGSVRGAAGASSGSISSGSTLGVVSIAHDVLGGAGVSSGTIGTGGGTMPKLTIGGSVLGGSGNLSGQINPGGTAGTVKIGGDIVGAAGVGSGSIAASAGISAVTVDGAVRGGQGSNSGAINANAAIGSITIGRDLIGGSATGTANLDGSGAIQAGRIGKLTLGGSLISGVNATSGVFKNNGAVIVDNDIGAIQITGGILGNTTHSAVMSARGSAAPTATSDVAIGKLTVGGRVEFATILGGFDRAGNPVNGDAQIGAVAVRGDWVASSLATGAIAAGTGFFGGADVFKITGGGAKDEATLNSQIASVTIKGQAFGTLANGDFFGIVAERVGLVSVGGVVLPTTPGIDDFVVGSSGDFKVNEFLG